MKDLEVDPKRAAARRLWFPKVNAGIDNRQIHISWCERNKNHMLWILDEGSRKHEDDNLRGKCNLNCGFGADSGFGQSGPGSGHHRALEQLSWTDAYVPCVDHGPRLGLKEILDDFNSLEAASA